MAQPLRHGLYGHAKLLESHCMGRSQVAEIALDSGLLEGLGTDSAPSRLAVELAHPRGDEGFDLERVQTHTFNAPRPSIQEVLDHGSQRLGDTDSASAIAAIGIDAKALWRRYREFHPPQIQIAKPCQS